MGTVTGRKYKAGLEPDPEPPILEPEPKPVKILTN